MIKTIEGVHYKFGLGQSFTERNVPHVTQIEVTRRCSLTCAHCYNNLPIGDVAARKAELTYTEYCRLLDELAEMECLEMNLTGGEVFVRPDFLDIYTYAKKKGFLITIFTNGTLITPEIADYLADWPPFSIEITLYGYTKETYERLTGVAGSYEKCLRGIRLLLERDLPLSLKTVAVTINRHEVKDIKRFAENLGLTGFQYDSTIVPRVDCSHSSLAVRLSPEEAITIEAQDSDNLTKWRENLETFWVDRDRGNVRQVSKPVTEQEVYHCGAGKSGAFINPAGLVSLCNYSHGDTYNWRQGDFNDAWSFLNGVRRRKRTMVTKCVDCQLKYGCPMCPAKAELESGHGEIPVEYICHSTHLRAYLVGVEVEPHGACEFCPGGALYDKLQGEAARIKAKATITTRKFLPVMGQDMGLLGGGCHSCKG